MKLLKFILFNHNLLFYFYLLIILKSVVNDDANGPNQNCIDCEYDNNCKKENCGEGCKCDRNCRSSLEHQGKCYDCSNAFTKPYYTFYSIENEICVTKSISNCNKIIVDSNECVNNCDGLNLYEFGDYCYSSCPNDLGISSDSIELNKFKCIDGYHIIEEFIENEKKYLRCTETCPSGYYDSETNYCVINCDNKKITPDKSCIDSCFDYKNGDYFLYTTEETIDGIKKEIKYCVETCPDSKSYYYDDGDPLSEKECRVDCDEGNYYSLNSKECLRDCQKMIYVEGDNLYCSNELKSNDYKCGVTDFPYQ